MKTAETMPRAIVRTVSDPGLRSERDGAVALLVESRDADDVDWARRAFLRFGGTLVGQTPPAPPSSRNGALHHHPGAHREFRT